MRCVTGGLPSDSATSRRSRGVRTSATNRSDPPPHTASGNGSSLPGQGVTVR